MFSILFLITHMTYLKMLWSLPLTKSPLCRSSTPITELPPPPSSHSFTFFYSCRMVPFWCWLDCWVFNSSAGSFLLPHPLSPTSPWMMKWWMHASVSVQTEILNQKVFLTFAWATMTALKSSFCGQLAWERSVQNPQSKSLFWPCQIFLNWCFLFFRIQAQKAQISQNQHHQANIW